MNATAFIKIGGVPEHFNLPWVMALENNRFRNLDAEISWSYFPGGTGAMTQALNSHELDVAILLTEGFLAARLKGLDAKIIHRYIQSPLQWGIYSGKHTEFKLNQDSKIAISRKGSGSHLMSLIHAQQLQHSLREDQFCVVHHLEDAIEALENGECDYFYWEHWMTLKYVQSGRVHQVGNFSAPWSGFLVVASQRCIEKHSDQLKSIVEILKKEVIVFLQNPDTPYHISQRFELSIEEAKTWMHHQAWNFNSNLSISEMKSALEALHHIGIASHHTELEGLLAPWLTWIP